MREFERIWEEGFFTLTLIGTTLHEPVLKNNSEYKFQTLRYLNKVIQTVHLFCDVECLHIEEFFENPSCMLTVNTYGATNTV